MERYYFYTNPESLGTTDPSAPQAEADAFGPLYDDPGFDKYRITNFHEKKPSETAQAIAVCDGKICIQDEDVNLTDPTKKTCTIILKPNYQPQFDFPFIKFFIYKGIDKSSIFEGDELKGVFGANGSRASDAPEEIPFVKRIWQGIENNSITNTADITGIKYDEAKVYKGEKIFSGDAPIDNFFYFQKAEDDLDVDFDQELPLVRAGEVIGNFGGRIGFEIVLERLGYEPLIEFARNSENLLTVSQYQGASNPSPDNADHFGHWHEKEACLNYIDPCAFYGCFAESNIFYRNSSGDSKKCNSVSKIHDEITKVFFNRGKVYIDVRDSYGFSLPYYGKKESPCVFGSQTNSLISYDWPLTIVNMVDILKFGTIKDGFFYSRLTISSGIEDAVIYLSRIHVKPLKRAKKEKLAIETNISQTFSLVIPVISHLSGYFHSSYYKVNCYEASAIENPNRPLAPVRKSYLDNIFRPLDLKLLNPIKNKNCYRLWHQESYIRIKTLEGYEVSYIASVGISIDNSFVTFFVIPEHSVIKRNRGNFRKNAQIITNGWLKKDDLFFNYLSNKFRETEFSYVDIGEGSIILGQNSTMDSKFHLGNPDDLILFTFDVGTLSEIKKFISYLPKRSASSTEYIFQADHVQKRSESGFLFNKREIKILAYKHNQGLIEKAIIDINLEAFDFEDT